MSESEKSPVSEGTPTPEPLNYAVPIIDSDEEEVFFGPVKSEKEQRGKNSRVDSRRETLKLNGPVIKVSSKEARRKSTLNGLTLEEGDESEDKENLPNAKVTNCYTSRVVEKMSHFQSPLSKFPALMERLGLDPETDDSSSSIVDVDNDQMFDNSIFTEYDDNDLSIMSQKISKKFRSDLKHEKKSKKCPKVTKTPPALTVNTDFQNTSTDQELETNVEKVKRNLDFEPVEPLNHGNEAPMSENDEVFLTEAKEERVVEEAPTHEDSVLARTSSHGSATSDWFNTTREEMILYEKYGEDYDLIVEKMSTDEKKVLKRDIANSVPKDIEELLNSQTEEDLVIPGDAGKRKDTDDSHSSESETSPLNPTLEEALHPACSHGSLQLVGKQESNDGFKSPKVPPRTKSSAVRGAELVTPPNFSKKRYFKSPQSLNSPSYLRPTTSSQQKTSPKNTRQRDFSESSSPSPARSNYIGTPVLTSFGQASKRRPFDMANIVSPVAQYIHTSNVPKLLRNIKPKATKFMEDAILAIQESDEIEVAEEKDTNRQKKRYFKPLPEAEYRSSRVTFEKNLPSESHKDLHKKFMTANSTEAVVVRHVGRERVPQKDMEFWSSSPGNKENSESGGIIKKTRESEIFDETSVEMSIHEVKKINKLMPSISRKHLY